MPRIRWAVRCRARRTDGSRCGKWAIRGGFVCPTHGGSLTRARWRQRLTDWQVERVLVTADLLGIDPAKVDRWHIWVCRWTYGVPAADAEAPKWRDHFDRRVTRYVDRLHGQDAR